MTPERLAAGLAEKAVGLGSGSGRPVRVAVDGAPWAGLDLVPPLAGAIARLGWAVVVVNVGDFLRPASVRWERGRDDSDAFYEDWVDRSALAREVLAPLGPGGDRSYLPSLWDAERDRATRASYVAAAPSTVVVVRGWFLLVPDLHWGWDVTVHLALSAAARRRRVPAEDADRELPAYARYDEEVDPVSLADVVVRCDDPRRPAVIDRGSRGSR